MPTLKILSLYRSDIMKTDSAYRAKVLSIYDMIPSLLSRHEKRIVFSQIERDSSFDKFEETFFWLEDSMIANLAFSTTDLEISLSLNEDRTYMGDTGLLLSHTFYDNEETERTTTRNFSLEGFPSMKGCSSRTP